MQVKRTIKFSNIWTYILFLMLAFLLFALVFNTILKGSAGKITLFFVLFMLTILCGSALFFFSLVKQNEHEPNSRIVEDKANPETLANESKSEEVQDDKKLDISEILPGKKKNLNEYTDILLRNLAREFNFVQGVFYVQRSNESSDFTCVAQYACFSEEKPVDFRFGETLPGQVVKNKEIVAISNIPEGYIPIISGLGKGSPRELVFIPLKYKDNVLGIIECASFNTMDYIMEKNLTLVAEAAAKELYTLLKAN